MASSKGEKEKDVLESAEENLASIRRTLAAIDDLNTRWKVRAPIPTRHGIANQPIPAYSVDLTRGTTVCIV